VQPDPRIPSKESSDRLASELDAQPELLRALAERWDTPDPRLGTMVRRHGRRVAFVGVGSSRDAALAGGWLLRSSGIDATVHMPSEPLDALPGDALVVPVSASGATPTMVDAIDRLGGSRPILAITRSSDAPIAARADLLVPLGCETEASGIAVWSFLATVAAMAAFAELAAEGTTRSSVAAMRRAADALQAVRADGRAAIAEIATTVRAATVVHVVAPIARLGPALQAAQVLREVPRISAVGLAAEDWDHAHAYLTIDPGFVGLVSAPTDADDALRRWVLGRGRAMVCLGGAVLPGAPRLAFEEGPLVRLLIECPVVESIALEAWIAARRDAGPGPP
jgi:fructoselysine-6-P-deglycase FrlB-like protein